MRCSNCGAQLDLNTPFCPNCGSQNKQAEKHIKDMDKYGRKFNQTKRRVVSNSKWFVKYIAPITTLTISVVICALAYVFAGRAIGYDIAESYNSSYNRRHASEIADSVEKLLEEGKYQAVYESYYGINRQVKPYSEREWQYFYNITDYYIKLRNSVIADFDPAMKDTYNAEQAIARIAESIESIESAIKRMHSSYAEPSEESLRHINKICDEMNLFLKAYCGLTDEDIAKLPDMDRKSIITLIARRMENE